MSRKQRKNQVFRGHAPPFLDERLHKAILLQAHHDPDFREQLFMKGKPKDRKRCASEMLAYIYGLKGILDTRERGEKTNPTEEQQKALDDDRIKDALTKNRVTVSLLQKTDLGSNSWGVEKLRRSDIEQKKMQNPKLSSHIEGYIMRRKASGAKNIMEIEP